MIFRVGHGYDIHRFKKGRPLVLGGVAIPRERGLDGHSDADCLLHAVADAILGAAGAGDIGEHFPPEEKRWKGKSSAYFVRHAVALAKRRGFAVVNVDATLYVEAPRLAPFRSVMRESAARLLGLRPADVNIKFKTMERLDAVGRGKAAAAEAVALLRGKKAKNRGWRSSVGRAADL